MVPASGRSPFSSLPPLFPDRMHRTACKSPLSQAKLMGYKRSASRPLPPSLLRTPVFRPRQEDLLGGREGSKDRCMGAREGSIDRQVLGFNARPTDTVIWGEEKEHSQVRKL